MYKLIVTPLWDAARCEALTTPEERDAAAAFGVHRRAEYLTWRAVVRAELGREVAIGYDAAGAPTVDRAGVRIAVSHGAGRVAVLLAGQPCGVDIERLDRNFERIAARYITPAERALSDNTYLAALLWCAKETLYKLSGVRELDFCRDLQIETLDLDAKKMTGRIRGGDPIPMTFRIEGDYLLVYAMR